MKLRRPASIIAACAVAGLGAVGLAACGGGSNVADGIRAQNREMNFNNDRVTLALYCQAQALDGSGDYSAASAALDQTIKIARNHPGEYRSGLTDIAQNLHACDPAMSELAFNVVQAL